MARSALIAFNKQIKQFPSELQERECGLIEVGRQHARAFDEGHSPSGGGVQRVLTELRKLADRMERAAAAAAPVGRTELDDLRDRRAGRLTDAKDHGDPPAVNDKPHA